VCHERWSRGYVCRSGPAQSFPSLLGHLATLTRNHLRVAGNDVSGFDLIPIPTPTQRHAFELLGAPIPLTLK